MSTDMPRWMTKSANPVVYGDNIVPEKDRGHFTPVVVIDPEDREQVLRLLEPIADLVGLSQLQEALWTYLDPKPPEPTGLGAVVEDADGGWWTRAGRIETSWYQAHGKWAAYRDINAVRVLSEGVKP